MLENNTVLRALATMVSGFTVGLMAFLLGKLLAIVTDKMRQRRGDSRDESHGERLARLTGSLREASAEVNAVLVEMTNVVSQREKAIQTLEGDLERLQQREKELTETIQALENVPVSVAEHFAKLVEPVERRSARRDYLLFAAGVAVTTVITVVLQLFSK